MLALQQPRASAPMSLHNYSQEAVLTDNYIMAGMAGSDTWGYVALIDSDVAKANAVPIIGYAVRGEIVGQLFYDSFIKPLWGGPKIYANRLGPSTKI